MKDAKLAQLAQELQALEKTEKKLKEKTDKLKKRIIEEMDARGTTLIETGGVRIKYRQNEYVTYDYEELKNILPTRLLKRVTKLDVDKETLSQLVQAGQVEVEDLDPATNISYSKAWPVVTSIKE